MAALCCATLRGVCGRLAGTSGLRHLSGTFSQLGVSRPALWKSVLNPHVTSHVRNVSGLWSTQRLYLPAITGPAPAQRTTILSRIKPLLPSILQQPSRTVTYHGVREGKRKSVKAVVKRFMRLHCGLWIRRKAGYKKKLWKKTAARKNRLREIVICNKTQSKLLDKMTTSFWKRRNWYIDDPYQKYHDRTNLKV
ncbi:large ribosomal subunit protein bL35m [Pseudophryne corroboree]|uniref:large ribosomal subunit protein bL35m n=1 Tax=Pseudophryne corroboree TaxID=495146 RepID=UPI00308166FF